MRHINSSKKGNSHFAISMKSKNHLPFPEIAKPVFLIPRFREKWSKARKLEEAKRSKEEVKERERAERKRSKEVDKMMLFEEDRVVSDDKDF